MVPALWAFCLGLHFPRIYRACSQPLTVDLLAAHQPESFPMTPEIRMVAVDSLLENIPNIKLVIFEPGSNEPNKDANLADAEKILLFLKSINIKTIYVSNGVIQNKENAAALAEKYGATYYGPWTLNVPVDRENRQYDMQGPGHMTVKCCELWAQIMAPVVSQALENK